MKYLVHQMGRVYIFIGQSDKPGPADFLCKEDKLWQKDRYHPSVYAELLVKLGGGD